MINCPCCEFHAVFRECMDEFTADFGEITIIHDGYEPYEGPYEVTPKFLDQILATKDKNMKQDVTVHTIPVARVSNPDGGNTVTIGG